MKIKALSRLHTSTLVLILGICHPLRGSLHVEFPMLPGLLCQNPQIDYRGVNSRENGQESRNRQKSSGHRPWNECRPSRAQCFLHECEATGNENQKGE